MCPQVRSVIGTWVDSSMVLTISPRSWLAPSAMVRVIALSPESTTWWPPWQTRFHQARPCRAACSAAWSVPGPVVGSSGIMGSVDLGAEVGEEVDDRGGGPGDQRGRGAHQDTGLAARHRVVVAAEAAQRPGDGADQQSGEAGEQGPAAQPVEQGLDLRAAGQLARVGVDGDVEPNAHGRSP